MIEQGQLYWLKQVGCPLFLSEKHGKIKADKRLIQLLKGENV